MIFGFNIIPEEFGFPQALWCLFLYLFGLLTTYKYNTSERNKWLQPNHRAAVIMVLTIFLMCLTSYNGSDYFAYWSVVVNHSDDIETFYMEEPYFYLVQFLNHDYILFRASVWGAALAFFCIASKAMHLKISHTAFILGTCFLLIFSYGRVSLAMAMVFCGYIIFYQNLHKSFWLCILGIAIFVFGFYFHDSIIFAMAMVVLMPFIKFKKSWLFIYILLIPFVFIAVKQYFQYTIETGGMLEEETAEKLSRYSESEAESSNLFGLISNFFNYARFYVPLIMAIVFVYSRDGYKYISKISNNLLKITTGIVIVATCFLFIELDTLVFYYRLLYMAMIPLCYIIVELYKKKIWTRKQFLFSISFGIISCLYNYFYSVYKHLPAN